MKWFRRKSAEEKLRKKQDQLRKQMEAKKKSLRITPPEGVPLDMPLATLGQRLGAQFTDFLITFMGAILFLILMAFTIGGSSTLLTIIGALVMFFIRIPYYALTELMWNGRTIAKRWLGLRVISVDGRSLSAHQIVVRNLMKEIEFFAPLTYLLVGPQIHWSLFVIALLWVGVLLLVPWRTKANQRLGDVIAGTAVILDPKPVLLRDLTTDALGKRPVASSERFVFATEHLDQYGAFELQVLEKILRTGTNVDKRSLIKQNQTLNEVVERIVARINYPEKITEKENRDFLAAFYAAQRAHLESRQLFGDERADKNFREQV